MSQFPSLKSGAGAQYPLRQTTAYQTQVTRFLDGSEQRFRQHRDVVSEWGVNLSGLDESEAWVFRKFFEEQSGRAGTFTFQDPLSGVPTGTCHFSADSCTITQMDEDKHDLKVMVRSR